MQYRRPAKVFIVGLLASVLILASCSPIGPAALGLLALTGKKSDDGPPPPSGPVPPSQAANLSPSHGASSVPVTTNLTWDAAANADSYEIYFGTNALAVDSATTASTEYQGNQTATFFDPSPAGVLGYDTTYYWRVDSANIAGTTTGDLWGFATESTPATAPDVTQNPAPADSATSVATDTLLSWDAAARATSYDVYFGTSATSVANATTASAEFMGSQTSMSYNPGGLNYSATYYWRIDSRNSVGPTEGDLWSFTTVNWPPPVADFTASPPGGTAPLTVSFTNASTGNTSAWAWDFGDGGTSTEQDPGYTYNLAGAYTVILTISGPGGSDQASKMNYIMVTEPAPVADFTADVTTGDAPLAVSFTDASTGNITSWSWDFENDTVIDSMVQNPTHTYNDPGTYSVILAVAGPGGSDAITKTDLIAVTSVTTGLVAWWKFDEGSGTTAYDSSGNNNHGTINGALYSNGISASSLDFQGGASVVASDSPSLDITAALTLEAWIFPSDFGVYPSHVNPQIVRKYFGADGRRGYALEINNYTQFGKLHFGMVDSSEVTDSLFSDTSVQLNQWTHVVATWDGAKMSLYINGHLDATVPTTISAIHSNDEPLYIGYYDSKTYFMGLMDEVKIYDYARTPAEILADYENGCLVVDLSSGPYYTIQSAIDASTHGDIVLVHDGTYTGAGNKDLDFGGKIITVKSQNGATFCIIDCENSGRGFYFHSGETNNAIVEGFTIQNGNISGNHSGGIYCDNSSPTITNCTILNNWAEYSGGIACQSGSSPVITNCVITGNTTTNYGGGIRCDLNSSPTITNCIITNNTVTGWSGGGIYCENNCNSNITNCLISGNTVNRRGGGIACAGSAPTVSNCTITNNTASLHGGGISCHSNSALTLNNAIVWGNSCPTGNEIYTVESTASVTLNYCDYANGANDVAGIGTVTPTNCITLDPLFVNATAQDYHLQSGSPCINAGSNSYVTWSEDLDGNPRIANATVDIGCYEHRTWIDVSPAGTEGVDYPSARSHLGMVYDSARGVAVVFGGLDGATKFNDTWEWDGTTWTDVSPGGTAGIDYPTARDAHAMAYDANREVLVLFGGYYDVATHFGDTWEWNGNNWTDVSPGGTAGVDFPSARAHPAMAYDSKRGVVVLFGGHDGSYLDDTWEWDGTNWTQKFPVSKPSARYHPAMAYDSAREAVVLFGGNAGSRCDDTWEWDGANWVQKFPSNKPTAREYPAMAYDSGRGIVVLFGGNDVTLTYCSDTWEWDGTDWSDVSPGGAAGIDYPSGRSSPAMAYDSKRSVVVLFGGYDGTSPLNDTWEY